MVDWIKGLFTPEPSWRPGQVLGRHVDENGDVWELKVKEFVDGKPVLENVKAYSWAEQNKVYLDMSRTLMRLVLRAQADPDSLEPHHIRHAYGPTIRALAKLLDEFDAAGGSKLTGGE